MEAKLNQLNDKQLEAVVSESKRLLVLAGAGSGKTKTLLEKLSYLMNIKRVKPANILVITFTKNATNEMIDRLIFSSEEGGLYQSFMNNNKISYAEKNNYLYYFVKSNKILYKLYIITFHIFFYKVIL